MSALAYPHGPHDKPVVTDTLSIGVIGAGVFGGYHAAKCAAHPRVKLVGVQDVDPERANTLAEKFETRALSLEALLAASDAVIIASSATSHGTTALKSIDAGCHVLVEKPLAHDVTIAERVVAEAERTGLVLQVGHQERFVIRAIGLDRATERPTRIEAWRETPPGDRGRDVSVTLDLMTHDIDLALWLMGSEPDSVVGHTQTVRGGHADAALAELDFGETHIRLHASRVSETPRRVMIVDYPSGRVEVDFNARTLTHDTPFDLDADFGKSPSAADSLAAGTDAFIASVLDGAPVAVTGRDGLRALRVAARVDTKVDAEGRYA